MNKQQLDVALHSINKQIVELAHLKEYLITHSDGEPPAEASSEAVLAEVDAKDDNHVLHPLFVSVYSRHRYYGGPEEGGWYGTDVTLNSHYRVADRDSAERLKRALEGSTKIEDKAERLKWARKMAQELDDAELRLGAHWEEGLLPEPDLPFTYLVYIETGLGSHASRGPRHYE